MLKCNYHKFNPVQSTILYREGERQRETTYVWYLCSYFLLCTPDIHTYIPYNCIYLCLPFNHIGTPSLFLFFFFSHFQTQTNRSQPRNWNCVMLLAICYFTRTFSFSLRFFYVRFGKQELSLFSLILFLTSINGFWTGKTLDSRILRSFIHIYFQLHYFTFQLPTLYF